MFPKTPKLIIEQSLPMVSMMLLGNAALFITKYQMFQNMICNIFSLSFEELLFYYHIGTLVSFKLVSNDASTHAEKVATSETMPGKANNIPFKSAKWDRRSLPLNSLHVHLSKMWRCLSEQPDPGVSGEDTGSSMARE